MPPDLKTKVLSYLANREFDVTKEPKYESSELVLSALRRRDPFIGAFFLFGLDIKKYCEHNELDFVHALSDCESPYYLGDNNNHDYVNATRYYSQKELMQFERGKRIPLIRLLTQFGFDPHYLCARNVPLLHMAIRMNRRKLVRNLLALGIDPHQEDAQGWNAEIHWIYSEQQDYVTRQIITEAMYGRKNGWCPLL